MSGRTDDGSMKKEDREVSLEKIRNDPTVKVILISFKAGNTGKYISVEYIAVCKNFDGYRCANSIRFEFDSL